MNNPIQNKASKVLEIIWLMIALFSFLITIQSIIQKKWDNTAIFGVFIFIALLMNTIRRKNRLKEENQ